MRIGPEHFRLRITPLLIREKEFGRMIALKDGRITSTPLEGVIGELNLVDLDIQYDVEWLRPTNRMFGLDGEPLIRMWQPTRSESCFMLCVAENRCKAQQYFLGHLP